jgi:hypothetical protein
MERQTMGCNRVREQMAAVLEGCATDDEVRRVEAHFRQCPRCQTESRRFQQLRERLLIVGSAASEVDLQDRVMARIAAGRGMVSGHGMRGTAAVWRGLLANRGLRLAAAGLVVVALAAAAGLLLPAPSTAWAIEQSIEAMRGFKGMHMAAMLDGTENLELWVRSGPSPSQMRDLLARIGALTIWVKDNRTFYYQRGSDVVYVDDAPTAGFYPWPGAELLEWVRAAGFREVARGRDPRSGHRRIAVEASLTTTTGLQSSILEFDTTTKMLVGMRQWRSLDRAGRPSLDTSTISYFDDLPDALFDMKLPEGVEERQKEVTVPEELLGVLAGAQYGLPTEGLPEHEAARRIVSEMYEAVGSSDWARFRKLVPVAAGWTDDMVRTICFGVDERDAVAEVLDIGPAHPRGQSRLGPLVVVPTRVRRRDGRTFAENFTVQVRGPSATPSCVVYAAYGSPYQVP